MLNIFIYVEVQYVISSIHLTKHGNNHFETELGIRKAIVKLTQDELDLFQLQNETHQRSYDVIDKIDRMTSRNEHIWVDETRVPVKNGVLITGFKIV